MVKFLWLFLFDNLKHALKSMQRKSFGDRSVDLFLQIAKDRLNVSPYRAILVRRLSVKGKDLSTGNRPVHLSQCDLVRASGKLCSAGRASLRFDQIGLCQLP